MGPRFCKRGNGVAAGVDGHSGKASMGPRFCKRGNSVSLPIVLLTRVASMGPRFCKRGNRYNQVMWKRNDSLQWGHAFVSVEPPRLDTGFKNRTLCFNGATLL